MVWESNWLRVERGAQVVIERLVNRRTDLQDRRQVLAHNAVDPAQLFDQGLALRIRRPFLNQSHASHPCFCRRG